MYKLSPADIKFAKIDVSTSGASPIVAAVAGVKIRAISFFAVAGGAVEVKWQSDSTDLTGFMAVAVNGGISAESDPGLFETAEGEILNINIGSNIQVGGGLVYILIKGASIVAGDLG